MSYKTMIRLLNALPRKGAHPASAVRKLMEKDGPGPQTDRGVAKGLHAIASAPDSPIEEIHAGSGIATRWKWRERHPLRSLAFRDAELLQQTLLHQMARRLMPPAIADHLEQDQKWIASELDPNSQAAWWLAHVINLPAGPPRWWLRRSAHRIPGTKKPPRGGHSVAAQEAGPTPPSSPPAQAGGSC